MSKIEVTNTNSGYNLAAINTNLEAIADQLNNNVLYRDNPPGEPNQMLNDLDMNGHRIFNLPKPINPSEALRLQDLSDFIGGGLEIPTTASLIIVNPVNHLTDINAQAALQTLSEGLFNETQTRSTTDTALTAALIPLTLSVNSISDLKAVSKLSHTTVFVQGYYAKGDNGMQNNYFYDASDTTSADNGCTIIVATDGGRWKIAAQEVTTKMFGCKADGVTDDSAAFQTAINFCMANQIPLIVSQGKHRLSSSISVTFPGVFATVAAFKMTGAGADISILYFPTTNGITINFKGPYNLVQIEGLSFTKTGLASNTALKLNQTAASMPNPALNALSEIKNCVFRGNDGYVIGDSWQIGLHIFGVSNVNVTTCNFLGNAAVGGAGEGVRIEGTVALPPVAFNFIGCNFAWNITGITYGNYVQGVSVVSSNFTGGTYGILASPGLIELDQLVVTSSQFNQTNTNILLQTNIANTMIIGNEIITQTGAVAVSLQAAGFYSIMGNTIAGNGATATNGIIINNSTASGIITGNAFLGMTTAINLQPGSIAANVQSNTYAACSNNVVNSGTSNTVGGGSP